MWGRSELVATIVATSSDRPHIVKVIYRHRRTGAWIARSRIVGPARQGQ